MTWVTLFPLGSAAIGACTPRHETVPAACAPLLIPYPGKDPSSRKVRPNER